jgi:hypothetical protein
LLCGHSAEIGVKTLKPPIGSGIVSGGGLNFKLSGLEPKFLNLILHANTSVGRNKINKKILR